MSHLGMHCWVIIYYSLLIVIQARSSTYYISVSPNNPDWCPDDNSCYNISEIATVLRMAGDSDSQNVSLILAPGNHSLSLNLSFQGMTNFTMKSSDNISTVINCNVSSKFELHSIKHVHIQGVTFSGCLGNKASSVDEFILKDSILEFITGTTMPHDITCKYRILCFTESNVTITNTILQACTSGIVKLTISTGVGAVKFSQSNVTISKSKVFDFNAIGSKGGALYSNHSMIVILNSEFANNSADRGGAIYSLDSIILISNSSFVKNCALSAGVLYIQQSSIESNLYFPDYWLNILSVLNDNNNKFGSIARLKRNGSITFLLFSIFTKNTASDGGVLSFKGAGFGVDQFNSIVYVFEGYFALNFAKNFGGVFYLSHCIATIQNSSFKNNNASFGGVGRTYKGKIEIAQSEFHGNQAGISSGAWFFHLTGVSIQDGKFYNNTAVSSGGSLRMIESKVNLTGVVELNYSSAQYGGAMHVINSFIYCFGKCTTSGNDGSSIFLYKLSKFYISGTVTVSNNTGSNGGGIQSIASKIVVVENGELNVKCNQANKSGGGIYLDYSDLDVNIQEGRIHIHGNTAAAFGGGIHSIRSKIIISLKKLNHWRTKQYRIVLESNFAHSGGGFSLEGYSQFKIRGFSLHWLNSNLTVIHYVKNNAYFGGAIFVADNTTRGTCLSGEMQAVAQSECFYQIITKGSDFSPKYPHIGSVFRFINNTANISGATLYGGLLDRCTLVNSVGNSIYYSKIQNSFHSISKKTSSDPVRVCLCNPNSDTMNCSYIPELQNYRKGSNLTLRVAALDQVHHVVPATIHSYLTSQRGHMRDRQRAQRIEGMCTDLNFSIFSPLKKSDHLKLYARGPCSSLGISSLTIRIDFASCWCPVGFEPDKEIQNTCVCRCHNALKTIFPFIQNSDCNSETLLLARHRDFWITAVNLTNTTTFISYQHCPSAYCHLCTSWPMDIDFSTPNGPDVQCAFNHSGMICGKCQSDLTLSIGSSRCIECPHLWPLMTVAVSIGVLINGLILVALILALNFTVAIGTLNAMIFYANVLATNQRQFMPFQQPNFHTVFISWLNLDMSLDICFFDGLDAYAKAWLKLIFPVYIIIIVFAVIVTSHYSRRFSRFIAHKNPLATLATLILLSYAKLLHSIIGILSPANLLYTPTDKHLPAFTKIVWLSDGSIPYLEGKHVPLFLAAVLILIVGFLYTFLLLSWQWLVKLSNKRGFLWLRNTKLSSFIDAYHAPYTARNRYWTGLLLLARVILYFTAAMNISGEPSVNLLVITLVIGCVFLLHVISGISVYKKRMLNIFEFVTFFNILAFIASKFYIRIIGGSDIVVAYISISVQIVVFICSLLHHFVVELNFLSKIKKSQCFKKYFTHQNLQAHLLDNQYTPPSTCPTVTTTEVSVEKPKILLKMNSKDDDSFERKELTELLEIESSQ